MTARRSEIYRPRKKWKEVQLAFKQDFGRISIRVEEGKEEN
jgi:hypothetical protein